MQQHRRVDERHVPIQRQHDRLHPRRVAVHAPSRARGDDRATRGRPAPEVPEPNFEILRSTRRPLERAADAPLAVLATVRDCPRLVLVVRGGDVADHLRLDARDDRVRGGRARGRELRPRGGRGGGVCGGDARRRLRQQRRRVRRDELHEVRAVAVYLPEVHERPRRVRRRDVAQRGRDRRRDGGADDEARVARGLDGSRLQRGREHAVEICNLAPSEVLVLEQRRARVRARLGVRARLL
mmetsp:Transcript_8484/g.31083  ORF Transcript_8484/g.31083 Transcript_8484/m.31083 type:complete len:240 (+) Transcript_8484:483-1202(+)